jgi:Protein of unknown function (Hypoth_ymh)
MNFYTADGHSMVPRVRYQADPKPEREAFAHLFAGAIDSYKNPHPHRTATLTHPSEAQEMAILTSHVLRILDTRMPKQGT